MILSFMICLGFSDLFKAVSKKIEGNMRKSEKIPGNQDWFHYFMICLGASDLFKAVSMKIKGNMRKPEEILEIPDQIKGKIRKPGLILLFYDIFWCFWPFQSYF